MKYFSLFSGIGGFEKAIETIIPDAKCVGYSEIDKYAIKTYEKNFGLGVKNYGDITTINVGELPDFDLLLGGVPCQSWSIAGKRKGFEDIRGTSGSEILPFRESDKSTNKTHGIQEQIASTLTTAEMKVGRGMNMIADFRYDEGLRIRKNNITPCLCATNHSENDPSSMPGIVIRHPLKFINRNQKNIKGDYTYTVDSANTGGVMIQSHCPRSGNPNKGGTGLLESSKHCFTLDRSPYYVNKIRRLTPTECERLQGFPDGWTNSVSDTQRYKQCGNAVTVSVIETIMTKLKEVL